MQKKVCPKICWFYCNYTLINNILITVQIILYSCSYDNNFLVYNRGRFVPKARSHKIQTKTPGILFSEYIFFQQSSVGIDPRLLWTDHLPSLILLGVKPSVSRVFVKLEFSILLYRPVCDRWNFWCWILCTKKRFFNYPFSLVFHNKRNLSWIRRCPSCS